MMIKKIIVAVFLISLLTLGWADTYRITITPSGTPACSDGAQASEECVCGSNTCTAGQWCCSGTCQGSACTLPTCTDGAQATETCTCGSNTCNSGEYCCTGTCQAGTCSVCTPTNDLTGDSLVDIFDLTMVGSRMDLAYDEAGDANCDSVVDIQDIVQIATNLS